MKKLAIIAFLAFCGCSYQDQKYGHHWPIGQPVYPHNIGDINDTDVPFFVVSYQWHPDKEAYFYVVKDTKGRIVAEFMMDYQLSTKP